MAEQKSFKQRVRDEAIAGAKIFKQSFVDYEYLICSEAFVKAPFYQIQAHGDNYEHLTGVASKLSAEEFFARCMQETLEEDDFCFTKRGQTEAEVKGSVRRKINVLPELVSLFAEGTLVEEDFVKNRIRCSFAAGKRECTLGFTSSVPAKPQSLLKGNQLDQAKAKPLALVLRKPVGAERFNEILLGDREVFRKYYPAIQEYISEELRTEIELEIKTET